MTEVSGLVWEALGRLHGADPRAALGKLVDAAGMLTDRYPHDPAAWEGTDRGYRIVPAQQNPSGSDQPGTPADGAGEVCHYRCAAGPAV
jgi:hypothetical protein